MYEVVPLRGATRENAIPLLAPALEVDSAKWVTVLGYSCKYLGLQQSV